MSSLRRSVTLEFATVGELVDLLIQCVPHGGVGEICGLDAYYTKTDDSLTWSMVIDFEEDEH